jgi:hypothetical protein
MTKLRDFLPERTYSVASSYSRDRIAAQVAACTIHADSSLSLFFPKPQRFEVGDRVTVHLDNRTGVESLDIKMRVYRASYRGLVSLVRGDRVEVELVHYQLFFGTGVVAEERAEGYEYPADSRPELPLPPSGLSQALFPDERESENKLGVWITRASLWPHSTVMAFLSSRDDDIFLLSHRGSFKSSLIHRDSRCCFAIDHRSTFLFERAVDWNFTVLEAEASLIDSDRPLFAAVQAEFVRKNPWEEPFFTDPKVELFHLRPLGILCAGGERLA